MANTTVKNREKSAAVTDTPEAKKRENVPLVNTDGDKARFYKLPWGPLEAIVGAVGLYLVVQFAAGLIISIYPHLRGWSRQQAEAWLTTTIIAQFWYVLLVEVITFAAVVWFVRKWRRGTLEQLGFGTFKPADIGRALGGFLVYIVLYVVIYSLVAKYVPQINLQQQQDVGFSNAAGSQALLLTFISLVILPPIVEETVFRGFLYGGLRTKLTFWPAAVLTSGLFASAHLLEGSGGGLLWVAGIDTFILSMVLVYVREKSGRLYPGMIIHALKNGIAFLVLYHVALGLG